MIIVVIIMVIIVRMVMLVIAIRKSVMVLETKMVGMLVLL